MPYPTELITPRLTLRRQSDFEPFALMSADADIMRYYPSTWTREQSDTFALRVRQLIDERGRGILGGRGASVASVHRLVGLHVPSHELPFAPYVEVVWLNPLGSRLS
jgi:ribosomal-protein-alanine N-acetyltransferase